MDSLLDEVILKIFHGLDTKSLIAASSVCRKWYRISKSQVLWKRHVLRNWPSQRWLYENIPVRCLNWVKIYQEFVEYTWYSPDQMKYFVSCNTIENEPISVLLRKTILKKMDEISKKWMQAGPLDHNGDATSRYFNSNMELFFNIRRLEWVFLDKRRGYLDKIKSKSRNKKEGTSNLKDYIRPYQMIPSCLLMYRFLCMFRSLAVPETGLTFYRIWRFRLKHIETGMVFELCDWKAAASNTFTNGCPNLKAFREDSMELLQFLTHPQFIMHPGGVDPRTCRLFNDLITASAGGCLSARKTCGVLNRKRKRKHQQTTTTTPQHQDQQQQQQPLSPRVKAAFVFGKQLYEKPTLPDIDERLEKWRARRKSTILLPSSTISLQPNTECCNCCQDNNNGTSSFSKSDHSGSAASSSMMSTQKSDYSFASKLAPSKSESPGNIVSCSSARSTLQKAEYCCTGSCVRLERSGSISSSGRSADDIVVLSRVSSSSTLFSECESSACESSATEDDSQLEETTPSESESSEFDLYENGYITNCEYFISNVDSLEDQHSLQASIADLWMLAPRMSELHPEMQPERMPVVYDLSDNEWYFQAERNLRMSQSSPRLPSHHSPQYRNSSRSVSLSSSPTREKMPTFAGESSKQQQEHSEAKLTGHEENNQTNDSTTKATTTTTLTPSSEQQYQKQRLAQQSLQPHHQQQQSHNHQLTLQQERKQQPADLSMDLSSAVLNNCVLDAPPLSPCSSVSSSSGFSILETQRNMQLNVIEAIPSSLALYRLICLFGYNCSAYISLEPTSIWEVSMLHKKTGGIIHFKDCNGSFRAFVTQPNIVITVTSEDLTSGEGDEERNLMSDMSEFRAAVTQLLELVMSETICHPYGIVAGTVA